MKNLTIKDIAEKCGVGISTVSRAINNDPAINEDTKRRVLEVVEKYHYVPNNSARNLKMTESNTVALMVRGIDNIFFQNAYGLFQKELKERGYDFLLYPVSEDKSSSLEAVELSKEKRLKGIIFLGGKMDDTGHTLSQLTVPYVMCTVAHNVNRPEPECASVSIDDEREGYLAIKYLIDHGHRDIAVIAGKEKDLSVGAQRLRGYRRAIEKAGMKVREELILYQDESLPEFSAANGYEVTRKMLEKGLRPDALFCISDMVALGAYKAIFEAGLRIPEDISVMGFDGIDLGKYMEPSLTTVLQPMEDMVGSSVDFLVSQMEGNIIRRTEHRYYQASLLMRDSVQDKKKG